MQQPFWRKPSAAPQKETLLLVAFAAIFMLLIEQPHLSGPN